MHCFHATTLVDLSPQAELLASGYLEHLVDLEPIAITSVPSLKTAAINRSEFDTLSLPGRLLRN